jgi:hypothetical protein
MYNFSFKERFIIAMTGTAILMIIFGIISIFSNSFRYDYWGNVIAAMLGAIGYQCIDALVYYTKTKKINK